MLSASLQGRLCGVGFLSRIASLGWGRVVWIERLRRTVGDHYVPIPQYDISASAGYGAIVDGCPAVDMVMVDRHWLEERLKVQPDEVSLISARGDSMQTTINNGDVLFVSNKVQPIQEGIYIIRSDGLLQVKRCQRQPGGKLRITSDNPAYEAFTIDLANESIDFQIVGRVIWTIKKMGG